MSNLLRRDLRGEYKIPFIELEEDDQEGDYSDIDVELDGAKHMDMPDRFLQESGDFIEEYEGYVCVELNDGRKGLVMSIDLEWEMPEKENK